MTNGDLERRPAAGERRAAARDKARHIPVKAGDSIPVKGVDVTVVSAAGKVIGRPLVKGAAAPAADQARAI